MDYYYYTFVLIVPAMIFALIAQLLVKTNYNKYSKVRSARGLTGAAAAEQLLRQNGVQDVRIERVNGTLSDHYDPAAKVIRLSSGVYDSPSIAAVGIACHEAGHALQHANGYALLKIRNAVIPMTRIGSNLGIPLALIGFLFDYGILVNIGLVLYASIVVFQLATLPVEFNASRRALQSIDSMGMLQGEELTGARKVLSAAALTYVAALVSAIATLLRLVLTFNRRRQ